MKISDDELLSRVVYSRSSGHFYLESKIVLGEKPKPIGWKINGYIKIEVGCRKVLAHRLAWRIVHGKWPESGIDHINGIRDDNRIANLREATQAQNTQNRRAASKNNKSGFLGVCMDKDVGMWIAQIGKNGQNYQIGWYETPELAHAAYLREKMRLHEFYAQGLISTAPLEA